jgi:hypothetical protein
MLRLRRFPGPVALILPLWGLGVAALRLMQDPTGGNTRSNRSAEILIDQSGSGGGLPLDIQHVLDECRKTHKDFVQREPQDAILFKIQDEEIYYLPRILRFKSEVPSQSGWGILLHDISPIRWLDGMKTNLLATISQEFKTR